MPPRNGTRYLHACWSRRSSCPGREQCMPVLKDRLRQPALEGTEIRRHDMESKVQAASGWQRGKRLPVHGSKSKGRVVRMALGKGMQRQWMQVLRDRACSRRLVFRSPLSGSTGRSAGNSAGFCIGVGVSARARQVHGPPQLKGSVAARFSGSHQRALKRGQEGLEHSGGSPADVTSTCCA